MSKPVSENEKIHPFAIVFYLKQLLELQVRFLDTVASAYYHLDYFELPVINALLNQEIDTWVKSLVGLIGVRSATLEYTPPYETPNVEVIRDSWASRMKPALQTFAFRLETAVPPPVGQAATLPPKCHQFVSNLKVKVIDYELAQAKYDANQFSYLLWEEKRRKKDFERSQLEVFPDNDFAFVEDVKARVTISAYYRELRNTYFSDSSKSSVILSGALIEALLVEALGHKEDEAKAHYEKLFGEKPKKAVSDWTFAKLLGVAHEMSVLPLDLKDMMTAVKDFRNFVHIQRAIESGIPLDDNYREICKNALLIVIKHVRKWSEPKGNR